MPEVCRVDQRIARLAEHEHLVRVWGERVVHHRERVGFGGVGGWDDAGRSVELGEPVEEQDAAEAVPRKSHCTGRSGTARAVGVKGLEPVGLDRVAVVDVVAADVAVQGVAGGGEQLCIGARKVSVCL